MTTYNKDGSERKKRVNNPTNFSWTEAYATIAFFVFKVKPNSILKQQISQRLGISLSALNTKAGEFRNIYNNKNLEKVAALSKLIYEKNNFRTIENCQEKLDLFLDGDYLDNEMSSTLKEEDHATEILIEEITKVDAKINLIKTKDYLDDFWKQNQNDLRFNGEIFNSSNLVILKDKKDLDFIESKMEGCYFIFSTLPKEKVPALSCDAYKCYEQFIEKDGKQFRCLYNGKGNSVKERLKVHLFSSHTLKKVEAGKVKTISGTGALSLSSYPKEIFDRLEEKKQFIPRKHKLKPVQKSIHDESLDKREGDLYFLNGIDLTEDDWKDFDFAVIVIKSDTEFGKILIEEAFCKFNGRPPLCRRHG